MGRQSAPKSVSPLYRAVFFTYLIHIWRPYDTLLPLLRLIGIPYIAFSFSTVVSIAIAAVAIAGALLELPRTVLHLPQAVHHAAEGEESFRPVQGRVARPFSFCAIASNLRACLPQYRMNEGLRLTCRI
jgi:hypothetical protein